MAITITAIGPFAGADSTDQSTYTTGTYTPTSSGLMVAFGFTHSVASGTIGDATSVTGACVTGMTKMRTIGFNTNAAPTKRVELWVGTSTGSAGTIAIAIPNAPTGCSWTMLEVSGADTAQGTGGVIQTTSAFSDASSTAWAVSGAAFADPNNRGVGAGGLAAGADWNAAGSWSRGNATAYATPAVTNGSTFGPANDNNAVETWTASAAWAGIMIEIAALGASGPITEAVVVPTAVHRAANW